MDIVISNSSADPIYEQIKKQVKTQILKGELKPGDPLPSIRRLARELCISVITTKRAYDDREREGFMDTVGGKGSFVSMKNMDFLREKRLKLFEENLARMMIEARLLGLSMEDMKSMLDLMNVATDNEHQPNEAFRKKEGYDHEGGL
jgi:GntR family transcriptional regulator